MSYDKLAEKYGVSHTTIRRRLKKADVQIRPYSRKFQGENALPMDEIIADHQRGMSPNKLAEKYGSNPTTIRLRLKEVGVYGCAEYHSGLSLSLAKAKEDHVPIYDEYSQDTLDSICKFYVEDCKTIKEISQSLELPYHHIRHILHRQGVPVRSSQRVHTFNWDSIKSDLESGIHHHRVMEKYNIGRDMIVRCLGKDYLYMGAEEDILVPKSTDVKFKKRNYPKQSQYKQRHRRNNDKRSVQVKSLAMALRKFDDQGGKDARVLCMPGKSCWDIEYFKSKDLVSEIVAIEKDDKTFELIKSKHGDVEIHHSSTSSFFSSYKGKSFDIIYLDYYSCFTYSVEQDLLLIFENKIVSDKGTIVINFFAGRESENEQIRFKRHFDNLMRIMDQELDWDSLEGNLKRVNAFNGFIVKYRRLPLFPFKENKKKKRKPVYCLCSRPYWFSYKTLSGKNDMLTGVFKVSYRSRTTLIENNDWTVKGEKPFSATVKYQKYISRVNSSTSYSVSNADRTQNIEEQILYLYEKNHYTPKRSDLNFAVSVSQYNDITSKLGLLRPVGRHTDEDILAELRRINAREGCVSYELLQRANIIKTKKIANSNITRKCIALCEQEGFIEGISRNKIQNAMRKYHFLNRYLNHLRSGGLKSTFWSQTLIKRYLKGKGDNHLRAEQLLKETKEYLDLINVVY